MTLTILADDLTGACDAGSLFCGAGPVPVTVWPGVGPNGRVRVVDTETRALARATARERVQSAASALSARRYFKKIDSTLRGRVGAEVDGLMSAVGASSALLTPAFPAQGRVVLDRVLMVGGRPIVETTLAHDPEFPDLADASSSVVDLLRPQIDRPLAWIPLAEVRAGTAALAARLRRLAGTIAVADAETEGDLDALVDGALALEPAPLLVGSAGLARALASRLGLLAGRTAIPAGRRWLVVVGSLHPTSRRQAEQARQAGLAVLASGDAREADSRAVAPRLAAEAARLLAGRGFDLVAVTGGDTAVALYRELEAERIDLVGPPVPGLALGLLRSSRCPDLWLLTKAGGFGAPDLFVSLAAEAA